MHRLASMGQSLEDYNYENKEIGQIILDDLGDVRFVGISVRKRENTLKSGFHHSFRR